MIVVQVSISLIIIAILVNFIYKRKNRRFYQLLEQFIQLPSTYPLIGNMHMLLGSLESILERMENTVQLYDRFVFWLGPMPVIVMKKHYDISIILSQTLNRDTYGLVDEWLGIGLISAGYEEWKKSKKILSQGFTSEMLSKYVEAFNRIAINLVENLKPVAETGEQIDTMHWMMMANQDPIAETTLGKSIPDNQRKHFCEAVAEGYVHGIRRLQMPVLLNRVINKIYLKLTGKWKIINYIKPLPEEIIRKRLKTYLEFKHQNNVTDESDVESSKAIIDLLIKSSLKTGFSQKRIRDELLQIIVAGIEPAAQTMSFLMLMLAMNQDVQKRAYDEIIQQTAYDETLSQTQLNNLVYLEQCVKETLRMFSPVIASSRRTHKEILLKDNTIVPKNTAVFTFIHFANYDPDLYKNPEKWDPDNFSDEAVKQRPKTSQLSFGYGPRTCIGARYSMLLIKTQIAHILRKYRLSTNITEFTKRHLITDLNIKSKIGYPVTFINRSETARYDIINNHSFCN